MRLSRDKVNVLARAVADALKQMDEVDFIEDYLEHHPAGNPQDS